MKERSVLVSETLSKIEILEDIEESLSYVVYPIIMNGDAIGLVMALSDNNDIGQLDDKVIGLTAQFLAKHIEE